MGGKLSAAGLPGSTPGRGTGRGGPRAGSRACSLMPPKPHVVPGCWTLSEDVAVLCLEAGLLQLLGAGRKGVWGRDARAHGKSGSGCFEPPRRCSGRLSWRSWRSLSGPAILCAGQGRAAVAGLVPRGGHLLLGVGVGRSCWPRVSSVRRRGVGRQNTQLMGPHRWTLPAHSLPVGPGPGSPLAGVWPGQESTIPVLSLPAVSSGWQVSWHLLWCQVGGNSHGRPPCPEVPDHWPCPPGLSESCHCCPLTHSGGVQL